MINPHTKYITDEASEVVVSNQRHLDWQDGYNTRSKELELVTRQLEQTVKQVDGILDELRKLKEIRNWKPKQ